MMSKNGVSSGKAFWVNMRNKNKLQKIGLIALAVLVVVGIAGYVMMRSWQPDEETIKAVLAIEDGRLSKGDPNAPVKMVEYVDMFCPFCSKIHQQVIPKIESQYIDTGKVHFEMRLIGKLHPDSERAGRGAYCAAEQGKFWNYIDEAYSRSWKSYYSLDKGTEEVDMFREDKIGTLVSAAGIDKITWNVCMGSERYKDVLKKNEAKLNEIQGYGTPHFIMNGASYNGAPPYEVFQVTIDDELKKAGVN